MAPTYVTEETQTEKIGKADKEEAKVSLNSADQEAKAVMIPPEVRAAFATKVWTLLGLQMTCSFIVSLVVEAFVEKPEDPKMRVISWAVSSVVAFISLLLLRLLRQKVPMNYIFLVFGIFATGVFWGLTKFIVQGFFNLNVTGICTLSLVLSAILHCTKVTDCLAEKMKPKGGTVRPSQSQGLEEAKPQLARSESKLAAMSNSISSAKDKAVAELRSSNDGVMRATMVLGIVTWLVSSIVCVVITLVLMKMADEGIKYGTTRHADMASAGAAIVMSFFMLVFFHYDCERQMRKCNLDEYMKALININSDIVVIFIIVYAVAIMLACNDQAMEMREGGGGFGGGDAGGDMGGMEGGAGGDAGGADMGGAGAEAPPEQDLDGAVGGDGV